LARGYQFALRQSNQPHVREPHVQTVQNATPITLRPPFWVPRTLLCLTRLRIHAANVALTPPTTRERSAPAGSPAYVGTGRWQFPATTWSCDGSRLIPNGGSSFDGWRIRPCLPEIALRTRKLMSLRDPTADSTSWVTPTTNRAPLFSRTAKLPNQRSRTLPAAARHVELPPATGEAVSLTARSAGVDRACSWPRSMLAFARATRTEAARYRGKGPRAGQTETRPAQAPIGTTVVTWHTINCVADRFPGPEGRWRR